jgi:dihydrofolate reductase
MTARVRVFIACSLDGFIAGPGGDLSWLPAPREDEDYGYGAFIAETSAMLMGRATFDTVVGFADWPYGELPVLVATTRPLDPPVASVRAIAGDPAELLAQVRAVTEGPVYLDGGALIRQFLDAGLVDELTVTIVPCVLGAGSPLFAGAQARRLELIRTRSFDDGLVQLDYRVAV